MGGEVEQELDDQWWLALRGKSLESVDDYEFTVVLRFDGGSALTIESSASVRASAREVETHAVVLNEDGTLVVTDALTSLIGQRVVSGVGFKSGELRIVFESGTRLGVQFGAKYEACQLTMPSGRMWVSLPGGGLATFPAAAD